MGDRGSGEITIDDKIIVTKTLVSGIWEERGGE